MNDADNITHVIDAARARREVHPHLRDMDESSLLQAAQGGDESAILELIARHETRIRHLVTRAQVGAAPAEDLQQEALYGILDAVAAFDSERSNGCAFFTYAHRRICTALQNANASYDARGIARNAYQRYWYAMEKADGDPRIARHWAALECLPVRAATGPDLETLAEGGDMIAREIVDIRWDRWERMHRRDPESAPTWEAYAAERGRGLDGPTFDAIHASVTYLDAPIDATDADASTWHDVVADPHGQDAEHAAENNVVVASLLTMLDDRAREVVTRLHGLDGHAPETQRAIALRLGLSRPRIANIARAAYRRMRAAL